MLDNTYESVTSLIRECERLAIERFQQDVTVRVAFIPSLDGDFFAAEVRSGSPDHGPVEASRARGKRGALVALRAQLRAQT
jgi:hypothetical protein